MKDQQAGDIQEDQGRNGGSLKKRKKEDEEDEEDSDILSHLITCHTVACIFVCVHMCMCAEAYNSKNCFYILDKRNDTFNQQYYNTSVQDKYK